MMSFALLAITETIEVLGDQAFTLDELARACGLPPGWVQAHVDAGVLVASAAQPTLFFDGAALVRARRIAELEMIFDADPQLAALTADLIEEVAQLRRQLRTLAPD